MYGCNSSTRFNHLSKPLLILKVVKNFLFNHKDFRLFPSNALLPKHWVNSEGFLMTMPYKTKSDALFGAILLKKE